MKTQTIKIEEDYKNEERSCSCSHAVGKSMILLPPKEVSKILNVKIKTLANWRSLGKGPNSLKAGGKVLYSMLEIEAFCKAAARKQSKGALGCQVI